MNKMFICPKCNTEYDEKTAKKMLKNCKNCGVTLKEKKIEVKKEYILEFDNFKIEFSLPIKLGREHQEELKINNYISRNHCEIFEENGIIFVIDSSTNGTFINGNKITTKTSINVGDKIKLANIEAIFKDK